jgi:predicted metalloendopeptidase
MLYKNVNGERIPMTSEEEKEFEQSRQESLESKKQRLIKVREAFLQKNDWQLPKIEEKQLLGLDVADDIAEYTTVWNKKEQLRAEINEIELATSLTDLDNYTEEI